MTRNLLVSVENLVDNEKQLQVQNPGTFFQSVSENIQKFYKEKIVVLIFFDFGIKVEHYPLPLAVDFQKQMYLHLLQ